MANSKYAGVSKDNLIAEIKTRRAANRKIPVDLRLDEDTLRTALDNDDVDNGEFNPVAPIGDIPVNAGAGGDNSPANAGNAPPKLPEDEPLSTLRKATPIPDKPPGLRNQLVKQPEAVARRTQPTEEGWRGAKLYKHKKDGLIYEVVKWDADPYGKTVKARVPAQDPVGDEEEGHPGLFWEGTDGEFSADFEKV